MYGQSSMRVRPSHANPNLLEKCELSSTLKWIGWSIHIQAGYITIPDDKISKVSEYLDDLLQGNQTTRKRHRHLYVAYSAYGLT